MRKPLFYLFIPLLGIVTSAQNPTPHAPSQPTPAANRSFLNRYCVACHSDQLKSGNLTLQSTSLEKVGTESSVWEKVVRKIQTGSMPPAGAPRPEATVRGAFLGYLETELDRAATANPNPGRTSIHRLNRTEYTNAVRDLLGVEIEAGSMLPADDSSYGFDNIANALSVSPMLLERFLSAGRKIARLAVGDPVAKPASAVYRLPKSLMQDERMGEELPFGSRGGTAIRHLFPRDGAYEVKIRLRRDYRDYVIGIQEPHQIEIRLDGERLQSFTFGGEHKGKSGPIFSTNELGDPEQEKYERTADESLHLRFTAKTGAKTLAVDFPDESYVTEGPLRPRLTPRGYMQYKGGEPSVDAVTISGPYEAGGLGQTASRGKVFICRPVNKADEEPCAKKILSTLARRAYRRPVNDADVQVLLSFYRSGSASGGFEGGIRYALPRILGPEFLFRIERDPDGVQPNTAYRVSDLDLASRLSFFLWSSIPDDSLLDLAIAGKLKDPVVLEREVRRMLADPRAKALVNSFASQWLSVRNLRLAKPDTEEFPNFDENLRDAFQRETELFISSIMSEDRSVLQFLNADYTFLNERLAKHYGIPNVYGSHFRRVNLKDGARSGLLGQGSILTVTSYANRTAPTIRGKWLLENVLGTPPSPPPPNVPDLKDNKEAKALTMRQRMEQHSSDPVCASCHTRMDPLGFALENFDAVGGWRSGSGVHAKLDTSAKLPDGTTFEGPSGLRDVLLKQPDQFVTTLTEKLLMFALGRGVESYDQPAVRRILRDAAPQGYRWSALVLGIVKSTPFQMRRSQDL